MGRRSKEKQGLVYLCLSVCGFLAMSVSFALMPIKQIGMLPGVMFWGGLLVGVFFQIVLEAQRKAFFAKYNAKHTKIQKNRNGLLSFGSNKIALVVDSIWIASVIVTICAFVFTKGFGYLCFICITVLLLSFCFHCIFNGRNYFHLKNFEKIRQALESKKESNSKKGEGDNGKK